MTISVLKVSLSQTNYELATRLVLGWSRLRESRAVFAANVHMLMEAHDSPAFKKIVNDADLVMPDGMPLVWMMRLKGQKDQQRVYGPTFMLHVLRAAALEAIPVGFYGGSPQVLQMLVAQMQAKFPSLKIAYAFSPPFRQLDAQEEEHVVRAINASGVRILFVGLGCPKQEIWMAVRRGQINAVMLGVGAAFDFHAGVKPQAPAWMQKIGLEWFFRLITEPRRLWKRYLYHNPRFVIFAVLDLFGVLK